ncbi:MAG: hypothetical protein AB7N24_11775 [Dehalococcoidia bacterium]
MNRRRFLALGAGTAAAAAITAACGDGDDDDGRTPTTAGGAAPSNTTAPSSNRGTPLVGDILEHALSSDDWSGEFGFITFRLHSALVDGELAYFIRTDASDEEFARAEKLVHVPLLAEALGATSGLSKIYLFPDEDGQDAILSTAPHMPDYSPAFRVHRVRFAGSAVDLDSERAVMAAADAGTVEVEETDIVVNYPVVKWPGGELPHDEKREAYLGDGQLLEPVDVAGDKVTFKLHACYPSSRYIVTDVTMRPMADGMHIAPAPGAAGLIEAGATAKILVFGNGVEGSGPMGFQKSITDTTVGDPKWSPYWDHYTFLWAQGKTAELLKSEQDVLAKESEDALERFNGTPDTGGQLFMVNCPVPVLAPVA